jgi:hypothetical protein
MDGGRNGLTGLDGGRYAIVSTACRTMAPSILLRLRIIPFWAPRHYSAIVLEVDNGSGLPNCILRNGACLFALRRELFIGARMLGVMGSSATCRRIALRARGVVPVWWVRDRAQAPGVRVRLAADCVRVSCTRGVMDPAIDSIDVPAGDLGGRGGISRLVRSCRRTLSIARRLSRPTA